MAGKVSIIILTYNNLEYTRQCLESIYTKTEGVEFEVIVVDNASNDDTRLFLEEFALSRPSLRTIFNPVNVGFARGNNIGAAEAAGDILVFLNNDVLVTQGWLQGLMRHLQDPEVGLVGPVTNASGNESRIAVDYTDLGEMDEFAARYTRLHQGEAFQVKMMPFQCVALPSRVFNEIGPLDERFGIGMFEDDDYALRLERQGYKILCAEDVYVHHFGSATFGRLSNSQYWHIFRQNKQKFEEKWGIEWQPHVPRPEFVPEQFRQLYEAESWFTALLEERESEVASLKSQVDELKTHIDYSNQRVYELAVELKNIYESNGWIFLQKLLAIRRRLIPEGSRRERLLRLAVDLTRHFNLSRLKTLSSELRASLRKPVPTPAGSLKTTVGYTTLPALKPEEEAWFGRRTVWPLISVILPVYNHADMLENSARSVLHNSYPNLELIILDDGSTDQIERILKKLAVNPRVRIVRQPNQKLARALTHAHLFARGDFINWTSADNLFAPGALERLARALLEHPEAVLVYADVGVIDEGGRPLKDGSYRSQNLDPHHPEVIRLHQDGRPLGYEVDNYINACFLYRREAAEALEFQYADDLRGLEDYDYWLRLQKCGEFYHLKNTTPLYFYRVHQRTMSHDLLTSASEAHFERGRRLIEYEANRRRYVQQRWTLILDDELPDAVKGPVQEAAGKMAVDIASIPAGWDPEHKRIRFVSPENLPSDPIYVRVLPQSWQLIWRSRVSGKLHELETWRGIDISPLAMKARQYVRNPWEFAQAGQRSIVGFHHGLVDLPVDVTATRQIIDRSPQVFFVFVDIPGKENPRLGQEITHGLENAVYLGNRSFGIPYPLYACFDAWWLPPVSAPVEEEIVLSALALAAATGRSLLVQKGLKTPPAPYILSYLPEIESLNFVASLDRSSMDRGLLDESLASWSTVSCLERLLRYADAVTQEMAVPRPDFGTETPPATLPQPWVPALIHVDGPIKCALAVNTLDLGGLEEFVGQLVTHLPRQGFQPFVVCVQSGGAVAERLKARGVPVYVTEDDPALMHAALEKERPHLVNSHWANLQFLEVASSLGLPVVEVVQNMYVWMDGNDWQTERARSHHFTHMIAVSELVKAYYSLRNNAIPPKWISIVPNGIDPERVKGANRQESRRELGLDEQEVLFISLASYDGRKNQLGLLAAFDEVASRYPQARLICAGSVAFPGYFETLAAFHNSLASKERIRLDTYRQDVASLNSAADVFVMNSFYEGWSLAATEALILGTPLIHSDCGSGRELVGTVGERLEGERGILIPNPATDPLELTSAGVAQMAYQERQPNTMHLIHAMSQMIEERSQWTVKRDAIRDYAMAEFNFEKTLQRYSRIFMEASKIERIPK